MCSNIVVTFYVDSFYIFLYSLNIENDFLLVVKKFSFSKFFFFFERKKYKKFFMKALDWVFYFYCDGIPYLFYAWSLMGKDIFRLLCNDSIWKYWFELNLGPLHIRNYSVFLKTVYSKRPFNLLSLIHICQRFVSLKTKSQHEILRNIQPNFFICKLN